MSADGRARSSEYSPNRPPPEISRKGYDGNSRNAPGPGRPRVRGRCPRRAPPIADASAAPDPTSHLGAHSHVTHQHHRLIHSPARRSRPARRHTRYQGERRAERLLASHSPIATIIGSRSSPPTPTRDGSPRASRSPPRTPRSTRRSSPHQRSPGCKSLAASWQRTPRPRRRRLSVMVSPGISHERSMPLFLRIRPLMARTACFP